MDEEAGAVAWLRQQVEFDKKLAAHQIPGPWRWWPMAGNRSFVGHEDDDAHGVPRVADCTGDPDEHPTAWHIALHDPLDVIADCDAKLAILDEHAMTWPDGEPEYETVPDMVTDSTGGTHAVIRDGALIPPYECKTCGYHGGQPCPTIHLLASGYKYRDGYADHWRAMAS